MLFRHQSLLAYFTSVFDLDLFRHSILDLTNYFYGFGFLFWFLVRHVNTLNVLISSSKIQVTIAKKDSKRCYVKCFGFWFSILKYTNWSTITITIVSNDMK